MNVVSDVNRKGIEMSEILRVVDLCKNNILKNISFTVEKGEMTAVMGPSGSGKSTLLYNISGMDQPDSGEVWLGDMEISGLTRKKPSTAPARDAIRLTGKRDRASCSRS